MRQRSSMTSTGKEWAGLDDEAVPAVRAAKQKASILYISKAAAAKRASPNLSVSHLLYRQNAEVLLCLQPGLVLHSYPDCRDLSGFVQCVSKRPQLDGEEGKQSSDMRLMSYIICIKILSWWTRLTIVSS